MKQKDYIKYIKTVNIIATIISSLIFLFYIAALIYIIIAYNLIQSEDVMANIASNLKIGYGTYFDGSDLVIGSKTMSLYDVFNLGLGFVLCLTIFSLLCSAVSLTTAILGIKYSKNSNILNTLFKLDIISSVTSILCLKFVSMTIFVISAVLCQMQIRNKKKVKSVNSSRSANKMPKLLKISIFKNLPKLRSKLQHSMSTQKKDSSQCPSNECNKSTLSEIEKSEKEADELIEKTIAKGKHVKI